MSAPQPSLFDFDYTTPAPSMPLHPGDIVRLKRWQRGVLDIAFPFWQVMGRHPQSDLLRPLWLCRAVPFSEYPGEFEAIPAAELEATGLSWRVPEHAEVELWMQESWGMNSFLARLNHQPDGLHFTYKAGTFWDEGKFEVVEDLGHAARVRLPPLHAEAELLDIMKDLPWRWGEVRRGRTEEP